MGFRVKTFNQVGTTHASFPALHQVLLGEYTRLSSELAGSEGKQDSGLTSEHPELVRRGISLYVDRRGRCDIEVRQPNEDAIPLHSPGEDLFSFSRKHVATIDPNELELLMKKALGKKSKPVAFSNSAMKKMRESWEKNSRDEEYWNLRFPDGRVFRAAKRSLGATTFVSYSVLDKTEGTRQVAVIKRDKSDFPEEDNPDWKMILEKDHVPFFLNHFFGEPTNVTTLHFKQDQNVPEVELHVQEPGEWRSGPAQSLAAAAKKRQKAD